MFISFITPFIYIILILFVILLLIGNISLMKLKKDLNIETNYNIDHISKEYVDDTQDIIQEFAQYEHKLSDETEKNCYTIKQQIVKKTLMKHNGEMTQAPILENFEDYAPIGTTPPIPLDKGTVHLNTQVNDVPVAVNALSNTSISKFGAEYRTPWNSHRSKDDISDWFDTPVPDDKKPLIDPSEWENHNSYIK